jgi:hypothetical protein
MKSFTYDVSEKEEGGEEEDGNGKVSLYQHFFWH